MAELTGFEPAISCVTGRHVRPLHHSSKRHYRYRDINWLRGQDLNLRPSGYEPDELPNCSTPRHYKGLLVWGPRKVIGITYEACASLFGDKSWWRLRGSNPRPSACKADALPAELSLRNKATFIISKSDIRSKCFFKKVVTRRGYSHFVRDCEVFAYEVILRRTDGILIP